MNNEPYGWVKNGEYVLYIEKPDSVFNYIPLYTHPHPDNLGLAESIIKQQQAEIEALKAFVKPIIAHGDDCIGNWDGNELQDLAVKTGLLIEVEKTQFCNLDKEEFIGCPCREYHYDEESWICLNTAKFLLNEAQKK